MSKVEYDPVTGKRKTESEAQLRKRLLIEAARKDGIDLNDLTPDAERIYSRITGEDAGETSAPMGEEDRRVLRVEAERQRAEVRAAADRERFAQTPEGQAKAAEERSWGQRVNSFCNRLGLQSDDPRVIALANRKWGSEAEFWNAVAALTGPGTPSAQKATPQLDAALEEWQILTRNPNLNAPDRPARLKRQRELEEVIRQAEKGQ